jgi:hypothetical protein
MDYECKSFWPVYTSYLMYIFGVLYVNKMRKYRIRKKWTDVKETVGG